VNNIIIIALFKTNETGLRVERISWHILTNLETQSMETQSMETQSKFLSTVGAQKTLD
jgi:hypothetical protein